MYLKEEEPVTRPEAGSIPARPTEYGSPGSHPVDRATVHVARRRPKLSTLGREGNGGGRAGSIPVVDATLVAGVSQTTLSKIQRQVARVRTTLK